MSSLRNSLKRFVRAGVMGMRRHQWQHGKAQLAVLMYHRVIPQDHPDSYWEQPGMFVRPETLDHHIKWLRAAQIPILSLHGWLDRQSRCQPLPNFSVAFTFDDGWKDNYDFAWPILQREQVPASFFVCPGLIERRQSMWPQRLARALQCRDYRVNVAMQRLGLEVTTVPIFDCGAMDRLICQVKERFADDQIVGVLDECEVPGFGVDGARDIMTWAELSDMQKSPLVTIGSHTANHVRLPNIQQMTRRELELVRSKEMLEARLRRPVEIFCYPNGDFDDRAEQIVSKHYRAACTTKFGWNSAGEGRYLRLKRVGVHEDVSSSRAAFMARLSYQL